MRKIPSHIFLPEDLFFNRNLSGIERDVLAIIYTFDRDDECYITNQEFANLLNCGYQNISNTISKLTKAGYIFSNNLRGKNRFLQLARRDYAKPRR